MGKALYRKHRPKKLSEIIGQDHITETLGKAIKDGRISHAYLFTGPRGTGKTSIARILAHEVNQLAYDDESLHLDIIEIDAASNRRIDEIRELKDRVNIAPTSAKYKIYIIDEVHMLTREAFNALLKTLEEPPEHVIFMLATTEAHKLPETIVSRTQRFSFRPVEQAKVVDQLRAIAAAENVTIDDDALALIAEHGGGSFRDSISLLDQVRGTADQITSSNVVNALGHAPDDIVDKLVQAVRTHSSADMATTLQKAYTQGIQPAQLARQLSRQLRQQVLDGNTSMDEQTISLLSELLTVTASPNPAVALELALYRTLLEPATAAPLHTTLTQTAPPKPTPKVEKTTPAPTPKPTPKKEKAPEFAPKTNPKTTDLREATDPLTPGDWQDILSAIKGNHNTLYGIVRMATPKFEPGSIELQFAFAFHCKRVSEARYIDILTKVATEITGQNIAISCSLDPTQKDKPTSDEPLAPAPDIGAITDIFGEVEVEQ